MMLGITTLVLWTLCYADPLLGEPTGRTVDEEIGVLAEAAPLRLRFHGQSADELASWQKEFGAELRRRIGPHDPPQKWHAVSVASQSFADFTREELLLVAPGVPSVPLYVLRPDATRFGGGPYPTVLCIHGHGPFGNNPVAGRDDLAGVADAIRESNYDYARQLARRGYLTLAPCLTPFGKRLGDPARYGKQDPCGVTFVRLMLLGQTLIGANLRDLRWTLDYAVTRPDVDADRIGCVGLSYGGRMTMLVSALDERIKVAVVSGALNVMQERVLGRYSCGAQVIPGLLEIGDTPEIASLIAPRPSVWEAGNKDRLVNPKWSEEFVERLSRAYRAAGSPDNLHVDRFDGGHVWHGTIGVDVLDRALQPKRP